MKNEIINDDYVLGIDLGTSNSCMAIMMNKEPIIIPNEFGFLTTPSYVTFLEKNERLVGELSKLNISSKNTIFYSKRLIGKSFFDKSLDKIKEKGLPFEILDDKESQKIKIGIENENKIKTYFYPEQISAMIIRKMKEDAEKYLSKKEQKKK